MANSRSEPPIPGETCHDLIGYYALLSSQSVLATDQLARRHGAEFLRSPAETNFVERVIEAASAGRALPFSDLLHLHALFRRAAESSYVTFAGGERLRDFQERLQPPPIGARPVRCRPRPMIRPQDAGATTDAPTSENNRSMPDLGAVRSRPRPTLAGADAL